MSRYGLSPAKLTLRAVPEEARKPRLLKDGDILMEKSGGGEAEPVGRVVLYDATVAPDAISSNFIVRVRPDHLKVEPRFLLNVLAMMQATRRNVPCIKQTTGIQNLDERAYLSLSIAVPPVKEQQSILEAITERIVPSELAKSQAEREIELMQEYRTRLTADVVTGKLDVRPAAEGLPDLTDETETEDPADEHELEDIEAEGAHA